MASLKNVEKTKQRIHKERSQLLDRQHLGQLEKKKDYKLRAAQNEKKRDTLKVLSKKALERNPDEFYYHMINSKAEDGVHFEKEKIVEDTEEQEKLMRTQNLRYIVFKLGKERKKIERLMAELHLCDPSLVLNKRCAFLDDEKKTSRVTSNLSTFGLHPDKHVLKVHKHSSLKRKQSDTKLNTMLSVIDLKTLNLERRMKYEELLKRIAREKELEIVRQKLETKQAVLDSRRKGQQPKKVKSGGARRAPIYKWPMERKR